MLTRQILKKQGIIAALQPRARPWYAVVPDAVFDGVIGGLLHLFRILLQTRAYALELIGVRDASGWWATVVRSSLLIGLIGVIAALALGGGEGPVEVSMSVPRAVPDSVKQAGTWGRAALDAGLLRVRDTCRDGAARLKEVST